MSNLKADKKEGTNAPLQGGRGKGDSSFKIHLKSCGVKGTKLISLSQPW